MEELTIPIPPDTLYASSGTVTADGVVVGRRRRGAFRIWPNRARLEFARPLVAAPEYPAEVVFVPSRTIDGRTVTVSMNGPRLSPDGVAYELLGHGWTITIDGTT